MILLASIVGLLNQHHHCPGGLLPVNRRAGDTDANDTLTVKSAGTNLSIFHVYKYGYKIIGLNHKTHTVKHMILYPGL